MPNTCSPNESTVCAEARKSNALLPYAFPNHQPRNPYLLRAVGRETTALVLCLPTVVEVPHPKMASMMLLGSLVQKFGAY